MFYKKSISRRVFEVFNVVFLVVTGFAFLAPILHVAFASISDPAALSRNTGIILRPLGKITLEGYGIVLSSANILGGYLNTIFYVVIGTAVSLLLTITGAYCLSRKSFELRNPLMLFISFTMLFNGGLIPTYQVVKFMGLYNSRWAIIIPTAISVFNLIIARTSFLSIPDSLEESARIDGASDIVIMFRIILPLSKAVIAVVALFYAVGQWNSWFTAMIYLKDRDKFPLQLILREILLMNDQNSMTTSADAARDTELIKILVKYCTIMVATVPILCVYPFIQKYFATGVMIGSIKG